MTAVATPVKTDVTASIAVPIILPKPEETTVLTC